ncbi:MAG: septum formation initiator family protein [Candidatus Omnitrophica bacterium]|nr:septum formation initiator family protein [Candidatus Omnitrophota bacterium]
MWLKTLKVTLFVLFIYIFFFPTVVKMQEMKQRDAALSAELSRLQQENRILSEEIEMLKTDPVYIESVAREKLKVARKHEMILRVVNSED